ncbi:LamG domain-containing protein [Planctobacterium marinum]|uniref:LamG domain-containing protein n=1 Tax=Planctobacterium marinum TaxID=1631968 RepID=UPI001E28EDEC|nr:LamG domain-containing protein [Planctobacterium marinum]MCC2606761.1 LamG domain-containing protein [Planctobacterium marinum]
MRIHLLWFCTLSYCLSLSAAPLNYSGISETLPTGSGAISESGLVAAWDFESYTEEGLLRDFGPNQLHGRLNHQSNSSGVFGLALSFSDKDDVVILPDSEQFNLTGPITIATKLKITSPGLHQHILACNDLFVLWLTTNDKYRFADTLGQGATTSSGVSQVDEGVWHSVVAVLSAEKGESLTHENIQIYVDGNKAEISHEASWAPTSLASENACVIGGTRTGAQKHQDLPFVGVIDEMLLFSRALSADEINAFSE